MIGVASVCAPRLSSSRVASHHLEGAVSGGHSTVALHLHLGGALADGVGRPRVTSPPRLICRHGSAVDPHRLSANRNAIPNIVKIGGKAGVCVRA